MRPDAGSLQGAGTPRRGDGWELAFLPTGAASLSISRWTEEVEGVLGTLPALGVAVTAPVDLRGLVPFARRIRALIVGDGFRGDLSPVNELGGLERLNLGVEPRRVDLSRFPALRSCRLVRAESVAGLGAAPALERLDLESTRLESLEELSGMRTLRELHLDGAARLATLDGIQGLGLDRLTLYRCRALRSVGAAALPSLRELDVDGARAIEDWDHVGEAASLVKLALNAGPRLSGLGFVAGLPRLQSVFVGETDGPAGPVSVAPFLGLRELRELKLVSAIKRAADLDRLGELEQLEVLVLAGGPELPSLGFLQGLRRLRTLSLGLRVRDGDLSPLLGLPELREARLQPHAAHYSHTAEELKAALHARHPELREEEAARLRPLQAVAGPSPMRPAPTIASAGGLPPEVMPDVSWRFDTAVGGRDELARRAGEDGAGGSWEPNRLVLPVPRIRLRIPEAPEAGEPELAADRPDGFTAAGLLFSVHAAAAPVVGDTDYRHFEGLVLARDRSPDGVPLYELRLGS